MKLESAHITNFKLLEDVSLQFSSDLARPLTVVRAENGSGKTSILYALRWAMYGENEIPPQMRLTSTAHPAGKPVQVQARIDLRPPTLIQGPKHVIASFGLVKKLLEREITTHEAPRGLGYSGEPIGERKTSRKALRA